MSIFITYYLPREHEPSTYIDIRLYYTTHPYIRQIRRVLAAHVANKIYLHYVLNVYYRFTEILPVDFTRKLIFNFWKCLHICREHQYSLRIGSYNRTYFLYKKNALVVLFHHHKNANDFLRRRNHSIVGILYTTATCYSLREYSMRNFEYISFDIENSLI